MSRCILPADAPDHLCDIRRKTVQVAAPAAGTDWSLKVPVAEAWLILGLVATFTTDATVATRVSELRVRDDLVVINRWLPARGLTATDSSHMSIVQGGPAAVPSGSAFNQWGVGTEVLLAPGQILDTNTLAIAAGDAWSAIALDVVFELNRGRGAAKRYADWVKSTDQGLPADRVRSGPAYG